jgi:hypothetical protein
MQAGWHCEVFGFSCQKKKKVNKAAATPTREDSANPIPARRSPMLARTTSTVDLMVFVLWVVGAISCRMSISFRSRIADLVTVNNEIFAVPAGEVIESVPPVSLAKINEPKSFFADRRRMSGVFRSHMNVDYIPVRELLQTVNAKDGIATFLLIPIHEMDNEVVAQIDPHVVVEEPNESIERSLQDSSRHITHCSSSDVAETVMRQILVTKSGSTLHQRNYPGFFNNDLSIKIVPNFFRLFSR